MEVFVKFLFTLFLQYDFLLTNTQAFTSTSIPTLLLPCYQNRSLNSLPPTPLSVQVLVELIRKLEFDVGNALNIRILTTSLLHSVRLDGIEEASYTSPENYIIPYRASGKHFHKYKLIVDYLTLGDGLQFPADAVNAQELCLLHLLTSNTINAWQRGDERATCQVRSMAYRNKRETQTRERQISSCPIEQGVMKTRWGTVSPSHLIAGMASVFQKPVQFQELVEDLSDEVNITLTFRQNTTKQTINNVLVATVVGDLAEVILNQATANPAFGEPGYWNNTIYPRAHYINKVQWDMTSAELLGGIDGLILANKVQEWLSVLSSTRLSQLIDMYYSERGVGYDRKFRACERRSKLADLFRQFDLVAETAGTTKLLQQIGQFDIFMTEEGIDTYAPAVVENYLHMAEGVTSKYDACEQGGDNITKLEIIAILDGTWQPYEARSIISYLAELTDVSYYGSRLGIINGQTGNWMANVTGDIVQIFAALSKVNSWPNRLDLSGSLHTVIAYYQNLTYQECTSNDARPMGHVILVLANTALISDVDSRKTDLAIQSLKQSNPEIKIVYVASETNAANYEKFANNTYGNDFIIKSSDSIAAFINQISSKLNNLPAHVLNFYCNASQVQMEDYVTPGYNTLYEIHFEYVRRADIVIKFKGYDYADFSICVYDANKPQDIVCNGLKGNSEVSFKVRNHCPAKHACTVQFAISANNTKYRCAEQDCRYPDQARLDIYTSWKNGSASSFTSSNLVILVTAFINTVIFIQKTYS